MRAPVAALLKSIQELTYKELRAIAQHVISASSAMPVDKDWDDITDEEIDEMARSLLGMAESADEFEDFQ